MAEQGARAGGERIPEAPLVAIGAILLAAAIIGEAVEGAGVKVPAIIGAGPRTAAGLLGLLMLVVGLASRWLPLARGGVGGVRGWSEVRVARRGSHPDVGVAPSASEHFIGREAELRWPTHDPLALAPGQLLFAGVVVILVGAWRADDELQEQVAIGLGARLGNGILVTALGLLTLWSVDAGATAEAAFAALTAAAFGLSVVSLVRRPPEVLLGYRGQYPPVVESAKL